MKDGENTRENRGQGIQVVARAAAILRVLGKSETGLSLGQIAGQVSLPRSTVQRIVGALAAERLVVSAPGGRGVRLGPEVIALAGGVKNNIVEHCRIFLTELARKTGETTDLSAMRGTGMVFLDQVPGVQRLSTVSHVGEVFPFTTTANGKSCLALLPEPDAVRVIEREWSRLENRGNLDTLMSELRKVRATGLAYDLDHHSAGISAIGFAFQDWSGEPHAVSVPVPSSRFSLVRGQVEDAMRKTAEGLKASF